MSSEHDSGRTGLRFSLGLSLFYATFFVVGYLAIFILAQWLLSSTIANNERENVSERLAEYRAWFQQGRASELQSSFVAQSRRSPDLVFVRINGPDARVLLFSNPQGQQFIERDELDRLAAEENDVVATLYSGDRGTIWTVASTRLEGGYILQAGRVSTGAFKAADSLRFAFLWTILPATLLALVGGSFLSYRAIKPARDLTATVHDILETGRMDKRVPVGKHHGEFSEMSLLFNRLLERNERLIAAMREALDNTSHDLRTPMTRFRATAEHALATADNLDTAREALADCMEESDRILAMLNTLMDIAEAETGAMALQLEVIDLPNLAHQIADLYELVAEENDITIDLAVPDGLTFEVDRSRLQQVVANLVDNALKYGRPGGHVRIAAEENDGIVRLVVADDGPGIPPDELPRIFDRLYRGDRSRNQRGLGLGLSFVKAIIDAHGGSVTVDSTLDEGTKFTVTLPKKGKRA